MQHAVRFENDSLYFSSSHFITFGEPEKVEALHGHNFRVKAEVSGPLNEQSYVIDFIVAFDALKNICEQLTHKVLIPKDHRYIKLKTENGITKVSIPPLQWAFPEYDTFLLPVKNTTTEAIAEHIAITFRQMLEDGKAFNYPSSKYSITVYLEESPGMWAVCRI
ncbi:6-pyruvoyl tetrahydrobiopterin synthase [Planctomycetales bacterium]|nr:6-pyruvoyl tetrahydrobiopterin synthase [Planctomycetales bacterium]